jgi:hypothetical protein
MPSFAIVLVAAALPTLISPPLDSDDLPIGALRNQQVLFTRTEVIVAPDGRPLRCAIVEPSGSTDLDAIICASFMKRARYRPAFDDAGRPTYGVVRNLSAWTSGGLPRHPPTLSDIKLTILPVSGVKLPAQVNLVFSIDAKGQIEKCSPAPKVGEIVLIKTACNEAKKLTPFPILVGPGDHPVSSVRGATIAFNAAPASE